MKFKFQSIFFVAAFAIIGCSSMSLFREADCTIPPSQAGQCFAEQGYRSQAYSTLSQFCAKRGKNLSLDEFSTAHAKRLADKCSTPSGVFTLTFRSAAKLNGPETCPDSLLTDATLKRAAQDGRMAGSLYASSQRLESEVSKR